MRINHNNLALTANNNLSTIDQNLSKSIERLSSGYKVNRASDDAAGLAISQKMNAQIRGLDRANSNAGDGVSLIQTAEGALDEVHSILKRMRELSVQAANDTYEDTDKEAIQSEIDELNKEIDRISETTQFNGRDLLSGDVDRRTYTDNDSLKVFSITDGVDASKYKIDITSVGTQATYTGVPFTGNASTVINPTMEGGITVNGVTVQVSEGQTLGEVYENLRDTFDKVGVEIVPMHAGNACDITSADNLQIKSKDYGSKASLDISVDNAALGNLFGISDNKSLGLDAKASIPAGNDVGFKPTATINSEGNRLTIKDIGGFEMVLDIDENYDTTSPESELTVLSAGSMVLQIGSNEGQTLTVTIPEVSKEKLGTGDINVSTHDLASKSIDILDNSISMVSKIRSKLGAYQNRLEHTMSNLETAGENLNSAVSRILDTDMAEEMSNYTQQNVLSQAATAMLQKSNARPENILQLLQS